LGATATAGAARAGGAPAERPLAFVEKIQGALRLVAVDRHAAALGLAPGLTLADARARVPALAVADADPAADARLLERLAEDCDRWTPLVALDAPDGLTLDITGCAHLFGGEAALAAAVVARIAGQGFAVRAAAAATPDQARALARHARRPPQGGASPEEEAAAALALPVAALGVAAETVTALARAGLKTLGDLAVRPSGPLAARFGEGLLARLRRTLGREDVRITPRRPPPACLAERRFAEPIVRAADIEAVIADLAGRVGARLAERGEGGRLFEASFFRVDGAVRRIAVETGRPVRDPATLVRLYRERLETLGDPLDAGFGFDLVRFGARLAEPAAPLQASLDGGLAGETEVSDLIDRLVARFGRDRVLRFAVGDSHDPARADRLVPAVDGPPASWSAASWPAAEAGEPPARPLHLFERPQPVEAIAEVPDGPPLRFRWRRVLHEVVKAEGPERIAAEWWRAAGPAPTRDYYRVEDAEGRRFWLSRAGLYGREAGEPRWFLHGLFA